MYRVLKPFEFFEPTSIDAAIQLLFMHGARAKVMAGGVDLVLKMRLRQLQPEYVVSLQKIPGLDYIEGGLETGLKFGALATLREIEQSPIVQRNWTILHDAVRQISSMQTKVMGTAVGNLCVATPASDIAPVLFVLGAKARITGDSQEKEIPIEDLFMTRGETILEPHQIVREIFVPALPFGTGCAFMKLAKTKDDIAKVNAAVSVTMADGECKEAKIALGSVASTPIRVPDAEKILKGQKLDEKTISRAAEAASAVAKPITDVRSTAEYRREMARVLVKDALAKAADRAKA
jgi:carbon-monoxide dehydrogenase medium subunit